MKNGNSSIAAVLAMQGILSISFQLLQIWGPGQPKDHVAA